MPNRELNDPMEKSNEIAHVNAELIPQDNSAESDDRALSRRRVLEAGAAALALLMMPKLAFGATCPGGNPPDERGWFGSGNGSVVHHGGNYIGVASKTWWWQVGYSWDASQWLCLSFRVYVESIFTDELYDIFKFHVQSKCGDVNTSTGHRIWFSKYKDNYLHFWVSNLGIAGSSQKTDWEDNKYFAFSDENLGGGNRSWWSITGWSDLGYVSPTYLYKRNNGLQDAYFGLGVYVYNVMCGGVNNWTTPDRVFLSGFTSSPDTFMGSDIHAKIDKITLDQDMSLFGKIVAIVPDSVKSGYQCLDVDAARQSSGTLVHLYGADGNSTISNVYDGKHDEYGHDLPRWMNFEHVIDIGEADPTQTATDYYGFELPNGVAMVIQSQPSHRDHPFIVYSYGDEACFHDDVEFDSIRTAISYASQLHSGAIDPDYLRVEYTHDEYETLCWRDFYQAAHGNIEYACDSRTPEIEVPFLVASINAAQKYPMSGESHRRRIWSRASTRDTPRCEISISVRANSSASGPRALFSASCLNPRSTSTPAETEMVSSSSAGGR